MLLGLGAGGYQRLVTLHLCGRIRPDGASAGDLRTRLHDVGLLLLQLRLTTLDVCPPSRDGRGSLFEYRLILATVEPYERLACSHRLIVADIHLGNVAGHLRGDSHAVSLEVRIVSALDEASDGPPADAPDDPYDQQHACADQDHPLAARELLLFGFAGLRRRARREGIHGGHRQGTPARRNMPLGIFVSTGIFLYYLFRDR